MNQRCCEIESQRQRLLALSDQQRGDLAKHMRGLQPALRWWERGRRATDYARKHPWVFLPLAVLLMRRSRRHLSWLGRGWLIARLARKLRLW